MSNRALLPQQMSTPANNMVPPPHTSLLVKGQTLSLFWNFPSWKFHVGIFHCSYLTIFRTNKTGSSTRLGSIFVTCFEINSAGECNQPYWVKASEMPFLTQFAFASLKLAL